MDIFWMKRFAENSGVLILRDGTVVAGAAAPESPRIWLQSLSIVKVKYLLVILILACSINIGYKKINSWFYATSEATSRFYITRAATCLQKFIDKPDPEGHVNKVKTAAAARALGANLPSDIFVIRWIADPMTDPNQLAAVAREFGC